MKMKSFQITSSAGIDLGTYPGEAPVDALNGLARDAGYADHTAMCAALAGARSWAFNVVADGPSD